MFLLLILDMVQQNQPGHSIPKTLPTSGPPVNANEKTSSNEGGWKVLYFRRSRVRTDSTLAGLLSRLTGVSFQEIHRKFKLTTQLKLSQLRVDLICKQLKSIRLRMSCACYQAQTCCLKSAPPVVSRLKLPGSLRPAFAYDLHAKPVVVVVPVFILQWGCIRSYLALNMHWCVPHYTRNCLWWELLLNTMTNRFNYYLLINKHRAHLA